MFDLSASEHAAIVQKRATARLRLFRSTTLGLTRPRRMATMPTTAAHAHETEDNIVVLQGDDTETEFCDSHVIRREELVESFHYAWNTGKVEWLSFPGIILPCSSVLRSSKPTLKMTLHAFPGRVRQVSFCKSTAGSIGSGSPPECAPNLHTHDVASVFHLTFF